MPTLNDLSRALANLRSMEIEARTAKTLLAGLEEAAKEQRKEISELIKAGASSGDRITDAALIRGYGLGSEEEEHLRKLDESLKGKAGELVAVLYSEKEMVRSDHPRVRRDRLLLGVLRGDELQFVNAGAFHEHAAALPVECYADPNYRGEMQIRRQPLAEKHPYSRFRLFEGQMPREEFLGYVIVGTDAVKQFIERPFRYHVRTDDLWKHDLDLDALFAELGLLELSG